MVSVILYFLEMLRSKLKLRAVKNLPRGLRESTRSNPAQLTNRQIDVLALLKGFDFFISVKTVAHHLPPFFFN